MYNGFFFATPFYNLLDKFPPILLKAVMFLFFINIYGYSLFVHICMYGMTVELRDPQSHNAVLFLQSQDAW